MAAEMSLDDAASKLRILRKAREDHGVRAETLPSDLVLTGLAYDIEDASSAALDLMVGSRPYRAIALVRSAFEAAQRVLVLATEEDYRRTGSRAWLYYEKKECSLLRQVQSDEYAREIYAARVAQMGSVGVNISRKPPPYWLNRKPIYRASVGRTTSWEKISLNY